MTYDDNSDVETSGKDVPTIDKARGARIKQVINALGQDESVRVSGKVWKSLSRYIVGHEPPVSVVVGLARAARVSLDWLATGEGTPTVGQSSAVQRLRVQNQSDPAQRDAPLVLVPRISIEAAAGAGALVHSEHVSEMIAFSAQWLKARQIVPHAARILTARGDSMEPTIRDGDVLIVDTAIRQVLDNGIYCLVYDGLLLVKRLFVLRTGGIVISSDNKLAGRDEEIGSHEVPELHIAGRVMWFGRTI